MHHDTLHQTLVTAVGAMVLKLFATLAILLLVVAAIA
jgi:hypothetical protein